MLAVIGFSVYQRSGSSDESNNAVTIGEPAPEYAAKTLEGKTIRLSDFEGEKAVMVNIWATWCAPCREEMPKLQKLYEKYKDDGLVILGVNVDRSGLKKRVRQFVENMGVTFPILYDPESRVVRTFQTTGIPQTFLISKNGILVHHWRGQFNPLSDKSQTIVTNTLAK